VDSRHSSFLHGLGLSRHTGVTCNTPKKVESFFFHYFFSTHTIQTGWPADVSDIFVNWIVLPGAGPTG
jgi:hypothetical protein